MEETISRIVSSSSTTRMRALGMALSDGIAHFRPRLHIPKVTNWGRKSGNEGRGAGYLKSLGVGAVVVRALIVRVLVGRVLIYGSCRAIREFAWRVDRPLVDSAGNGRPHRGRRQSAFLPGISGTMPAGLGSGLGRL